MAEMSERTRRKIRNKIAMRYRRKAEELGNPDDWKWIQINGKRFEEALYEALKNYDPEKEEMTADEELDEFYKNITGHGINEKPEKTAKSREKEPFNWNDIPTTSAAFQIWGAETEEERFEKMKETEREINAELEAARIPVCPRCKCNPCICAYNDY